MLLTNTQVGRNTKALVAGVGERALRHPAAMGAIFKAIDEIAEDVVTILLTPPEKSGGEKRRDEEPVSSYECGAHPVSKTEQEVRLEELVEMNQGLLQGIGVSHLSIESICQITAAYKLQSKLTGAGGGGCVLTFVPHSILTQAFQFRSWVASYNVVVILADSVIRFSGPVKISIADDGRVLDP